MNQTLLCVEQYFLWIIFYSFIGWSYETLLCSIQDHKFVHRGFLKGPYCPIYGLCALFMITLMNDIENIVTIFFLSMCIASIAEYVTSWILEKVFHSRWWDYSQFKYQIHGRICLVGALVFGSFAVLLIKIIHPFLLCYINQIPDQILHYSFCILLLLFVMDCLYTVNRLSSIWYKIKKMPSTISVLRTNAFSSFPLPDYDKVLQDMKSLIHRAKNIKDDK